MEEKAQIQNDQIKQYLISTLKTEQINFYQLAGDASARKYYRVIQDKMTYVLMSWEPFDETSYPFIDVLKHFELNGVCVPKIIHIKADQGFILLEDLGDLTVERKFWESQDPNHSWPFYQKSLEQIIQVHTKATESDHLSICKKIMFDTDKFNWELNYAKEHLIEGVLKYPISEPTKKELTGLFNDISSKLHAEPKVICHRDYHSRNLMIKLDQVIVIDFQDARLGPVQYDLVSLIKDSYVDISDEYGQKMLNYYLEHTEWLKKANISKDQFNEVYELQSIQRCFKACGSFASFMNTRQDRRYLKYLKPTLKRVLKSLTYFSEYQLLIEVLINSGAFDKNYEQL